MFAYFFPFLHSGCTFSWLEEQCKPQLLQDTLAKILVDVRLEEAEMMDKKDQEEEEEEEREAAAPAKQSSSSCCR